MYATTAVNYAGWYIDEVFLGPVTSRTNMTQSLGSTGSDRSLMNYNVYRMLAADQETPENWTLIQSGVTNTNYLDTGFASLPGGKYKWAVRANYSGGHLSPAVISNQLGIVFTPQNVVPTVLGNNVTLTWAADAGASYYTIYGSDDPYGSNWTMVGYSPTNSFVFNATNVPYKFFKISASDGVMPVGRNK